MWKNLILWPALFVWVLFQLPLGTISLKYLAIFLLFYWNHPSHKQQKTSSCLWYNRGTLWSGIKFALLTSSHWHSNGPVAPLWSSLEDVHVVREHLLGLLDCPGCGLCFHCHLVPSHLLLIPRRVILASSPCLLQVACPLPLSPAPSTSSLGQKLSIYNLIHAKCWAMYLLLCRGHCL